MMTPVLPIRIERVSNIDRSVFHVLGMPISMTNWHGIDQAMEPPSSVIYRDAERPVDEEVDGPLDLKSDDKTDIIRRSFYFKLRRRPPDMFPGCITLTHIVCNTCNTYQYIALW